MHTTLIVVAASARARIFSVSGIGGKLHEIADLTHPGARLHDRELSSDRPGRSFDSHGQGRHGMQQPTSPQQHESHLFAVEIADYVDRARREKNVDSLILVAPPKFLGRLRSELSKSTRALLAGELGKNLVEADIETLAHHLDSMVQLHPQS